MVFDGANKRIILTTTSISASQIWSAYIDWLSADSNNARWGIAMTQAGGDDLGSGLFIPIYIFLQNGWRVRPMESSHQLMITGNLFVAEGGSPLVNTLGNYNVIAQYTVPVQAQAVATSGSTINTSEISASVWANPSRTLTSAGAGGATAQEVWEYSNRELTSALPSGLDETQLHTALDSYANKDSYKADVSNLSADVNVVKVNGVAVNSVDDFKADSVAVDLSGIPHDVWTYGTRVLTVAAGLTTAQDAKLNSLNNYTGLHADLDSYNNKGDWKANVSSLISGVNVTRVAGAIVNNITDFYDVPVDLAPLTTKVNAVQTTINSVSTKVDGLQSVAFTESDRTKLNSLANYTSMHSDLDSYANKSAWKADVAAITAGVNVTKVAGIAVSGVADFRGAATDITPVLTAISGLNDVSASEVRAAFNANDFKGENTELQIHTWLDSYGNKSQWKTDVSSLVAGVNVKAVNGVAVTGITDFRASATDLTPVITAINGLNNVSAAQVRAAFNPADFKDKNTQTEIHSWLDSYGNKGSWKADITGLTSGVNITKVAGVTVNGVSDFVGAATDLSGVISKIDTVQAAVGVVNDKLTSVAAKGEFTTVDRAKLNGLNNYTGLHGELDSYSNKALWKADLSPVIAGVNITKVAGVSVTGVNDFKASAPDLSGLQSSLMSIKTDTGMIRGDVVELENYNDSAVRAKLDAIIAKDTFAVDDRALLADIAGRVDVAIGDIASSGDEIKSHVTDGISVLATSGSVATVKSELDLVKAEIDSIVGRMVALDEESIASIYNRIAELKADIANVKATAEGLPSAVWDKVV